jgi:hypothetical protein
LRNRSEQELAGYRDAQDYLFQQDWRPLNAGLILHLHRLLFAHTAAVGGTFKTEDNLAVTARQTAHHRALQARIRGTHPVRCR